MYSYNVQSEIIKFHLRQIQVYIAVFFDVFEQLDIFLKTQERVQKIELKYVFLGNPLMPSHVKVMLMINRHAAKVFMQI